MSPSGVPQGRAVGFLDRFRRLLRALCPPRHDHPPHARRGHQGIQVDLQVLTKEKAREREGLEDHLKGHFVCYFYYCYLVLCHRCCSSLRETERSFNTEDRSCRERPRTETAARYSTFRFFLKKSTELKKSFKKRKKAPTGS